jgi:Flavin containing amine oxidoreductase
MADPRPGLSRRAVLAGGVLTGTALVLATSSEGPAGAVGIPMPMRSWVTDWSRDPYAMGTYATLPPGSTSAIRPRAERLAGSGFVLAGEAYDTVSPGTVNGALSSGRRAAQALIQAARQTGGPKGRSVAVIGAGVAGLAAGAASTPRSERSCGPTTATRRSSPQPGRPFRPSSTARRRTSCGRP